MPGTAAGVSRFFEQTGTEPIIMQDEHSLHRPAGSRDLRNQAERCRRLSRSVYDRATAEMLNKMAQNFDRSAEAANED